MSEKTVVFRPSSYEHALEMKLGGFNLYDNIEFSYYHEYKKEKPQLIGYAGAIINRLSDICDDGDDPALDRLTEALYDLPYEAFLVDISKREIHVLEYNKVQGLNFRKYGLTALLKKYRKDYPDSGIADNFADILAPYITKLFPNFSKYQISFTDTPSEMYKVAAGGPNSCMVGEKYPEFYDTAPAQGVMVHSPSGKLIARCILWTLDDGRTAFDRVYSTEPAIKQHLEVTLLAQGHINLYDCGHGELKDITVTAPISPAGIPYMDTLEYVARVDRNNLILGCNAESIRKVVGDDVSLHATSSTTGGVRFRPYVTTVCGAEVDIENAIEGIHGEYYLHSTVETNYYDAISIVKGDLPIKKLYIRLYLEDGLQPIIPAADIGKWEVYGVINWWGSTQEHFRLKSEV